MACGCGGCGVCSCCTGEIDCYFYLTNPGFVSCKESVQIDSFNGVTPVAFSIISAPTGVTISSTGLLAVPDGVTGYITIRGTDHVNNIYDIKIAIYCPLPDPRLGAGNCCDVFIRLQGCFPITITDAKGRTRTVNSDKDYQFIVL